MLNLSFTYIEETVRPIIINDVKKVALYHNRYSKEKNVGFFGVPMQVFCYIDFLGKIAFDDKSNTKRAEKFIKKYFPKHYNDYAELLYSMWRHGMIHQFVPKSFFAKFDGLPKMISVRWLANKSNKKHNRKANMKFFSLIRDRNNLTLVINICQLVDDLIIALDNFINEAKEDDIKRLEFEKRLNKSIGIFEIRNDMIRNQLQLASDLCSGQIDEKGNIVNWY
ncbi:hypothetical protein H8E88_04170 [candidate division KSB1 bacterium]|nr:hypothetical protein [candidate division KSB1 bacterium]